MANKGILAGIAIAGVAVVGAAIVLSRKDVTEPGPGLECEPGFHEENGQCVPDSTSCPTGFHFENGICVPDEVIPPGEEILITSLTYNPRSGDVPLTVGFVIQVKGVPEVIQWVFGDGQIEIGNLSRSHTYFSPGVYTGSITVTNKDGLTDTKFFTVTVNEPEEPGPGTQDIISSFFQDQATVIQNQSIAFGISLSEPFSNIKEIRWHWADGTPDIVGKTNNELAVDHFYNKTGVFKGNVTVKLNNGETDTREFFVTVEGDVTITMTAKIILSGFFGTTIEVGEQFRAFIDRSGGISPYTYEMDYGDGTIVHQQDSVHSYA